MKAATTSFAALLLLFTTPSRAEVPERTEAGQALRVPEKELDMGMVYHVEPGQDTQILLRSRTPLRRTVITTRRAVGYAVVPFDLEEGQAPILTAAFRIPVASLAGDDETIQGPGFLDASNHPEIAIEVSAIEDVVSKGSDGDSKTFELVMRADLWVKGQKWEIRFPAEVALHPATFQTMARNVGDLMTIRGSMTIKLEDYGFKPPRRHQASVAPELPVDVFLLLNTVSPDKSLDPRENPSFHSKQLHFLTLIRDLNDPVAGYRYGRSLMKQFWDDASQLEKLASAVVKSPEVKRRDLPFALKALQRAGELTQHKDSTILDTLARTYFEMGDVASAVESQEKAVANADSNPRRSGALKSTLERYRKAIPE